MARLDKLKSLARELIKLKCVVEVIGNAVMCHLSVNPTSPTVTKVTKRWQALKWEERTPREKPSAGNIERIFFIQGMDVINISSIDGKYVKFLLFTPGADKDIKG
jgi:hypothetical protein